MDGNNIEKTTANEVKNVLRKYDYICGLNIFRDGEKINWYAFTFT